MRTLMLALLLAGCGSQESKKDSAPPPTQTATVAVTATATSTSTASVATTNTGTGTETATATTAATSTATKTATSSTTATSTSTSTGITADERSAIDAIVAVLKTFTLNEPLSAFTQDQLHLLSGDYSQNGGVVSYPDAPSYSKFESNSYWCGSTRSTFETLSVGPYGVGAPLYAEIYSLADGTIKKVSASWLDASTTQKTYEIAAPCN